MRSGAPAVHGNSYENTFSAVIDRRKRIFIRYGEPQAHGNSVVNKVLEPFLSLASHNSSAFPGLSTFNSFYSFSLSLTPRDGHTSLAQRMKLSEIARKLGCELKSDGDVEIRRVAGIDEAGPGDLTFVSNRKYIRRIKSTRASAIILGNDVPEAPLPSLRTDDPYLAFAKAIDLF